MCVINIDANATDLLIQRFLKMWKWLMKHWTTSSFHSSSYLIMWMVLSILFLGIIDGRMDVNLPNVGYTSQLKWVVACQKLKFLVLVNSWRSLCNKYGQCRYSSPHSSWHSIECVSLRVQYILSIYINHLEFPDLTSLSSSCIDNVR